ncbi:hypothetical protein ILUMI_14168 [Ignelater luminosus]|uniref:Uncharacterized protein n=1 Tax=Ignelater luminosus TaxID=2038154 RepID=A0A8K0G539_IGNLU|nr:hypothetical protein ILUMI_14168 [Ignelater luminosus]
MVLAHNGRAVITYLNERFDNKAIATSTPAQWPARSANLTPLVYYLWETIKNKVYGSHFNYNNVEQLREAVVEALKKINLNTLRKVTSSAAKQCRLCLANLSLF